MPGDDDAGGRVLAVTHHDAHRVRGRSVRYRSTRTVGAPAYENLGSGSDTTSLSAIDDFLPETMSLIEIGQSNLHISGMK